MAECGESASMDSPSSLARRFSSSLSREVFPTARFLSIICEICKQHIRILDLLELGKLEEAADYLRDHLDPAKNLKHKIAVKEVKKPEKLAEQPQSRGKGRAKPV